MKCTKFFSIAAAMLMFLSCQKDELENDSTTIPDTAGQTEIKSLMGSDIPVIKIGPGVYMNGDIELYEENFDNSESIGLSNPEPGVEYGSKLAIGGGVRKWPNNTVVYVIGGGLSDKVKSELQKSFDEWESKTTIRFKERTNESNYVTISGNGRNCNCGSANLGVNGSRGRINLGSGSTAFVIIHEIGHTLGYIHEQNRSDRDDYVKVLFENIQDGAENQFFKSNSAQLLTDRMDTKSTMMYGSYTFSKNRQPTIVDLNNNPLPRNNGRLSEGDIAGTNRAYPGGGTTPTNPKDPCDGVSEWSPNNFYRVGDKVTYRGYLYERDFTRWNQLSKCGAPDTTDICSGISEYDSNRSYREGDKVTFRGSLYRRVVNGWIKEGPCGA